MTAREGSGGGAGVSAGAGERGFSLIELVVAVAVFAILSAGLALTIEGGLNLARNNRNRSIAANLASQEMDDVRSTTFTALPLGLVDRSESVDGVPYTVRRETEWTDNASTTGPCDSTNATPRVLRVSVSVFWADMRGVAPAKSSTILSPPVGSFDPLNGHIAVKVLGSTADPLAGVPVTVTSGSFVRNLTTTSSGCAFFAFVAPATYTVSLGAVGYVDRQGSPTASQITGVTSGATSSVAFDYDRAASLSLSLTTSAGGSFPSSVPISVGNTGLIPTGSKAYAGTGALRTIGNLFPYADGYAAWAGDCADADPEGQDGSGVAFWDGASRATAFETSPAGAVSGTVTVPTVEVHYGDVSWSSGTQDIVAVHDADNGCPTGRQYTVATVSGPGTVLVAIPYGTWTFEIPTASPYGGSWSTVTVDPRVSGTTTVNVDSL